MEGLGRYDMPPYRMEVYMRKSSIKDFQLPRLIPGMYDIAVTGYVSRQTMPLSHFMKFDLVENAFHTGQFIIVKSPASKN